MARTTSRPLMFTVAPVTWSPGPTSDGIDSPVTSDASIAELPSTTTPSVAIFSPGRTTNRSPAVSESSGHPLLGPVAQHRDRLGAQGGQRGQRGT